ncbi:MAG: DUF169 domain-containing protein [Vicinamibacterales bacterium]
MEPTHVRTLAQLNLENPPVAIGFLAEPPEGLPHMERPEAASCSYWKRAASGESFYTTPEDHGNCAVGAYTHGVLMTPAQGEELQGLIGTMVELRYLKSEEVARIPKRSTPLQVAAYAPLDRATFAPDLVLFRGNARQIMLLSEAARAAGVFSEGSVMGRPACSMLPQALAANDGVASMGCIGNRVYTGLDDNEMYLTVPGASANAVLDQLAVAMHANQALEEYHRERAAAISG